MRKATNIIDKPRIEGGRDLLGTDKYLEALNRFILSANMPTTIAIQGEWGSGKTSMMNQIKFNLCESIEKPGADFYAVWVNTWQYSLMKTGDETLVAIIHGLTKHVLNIIQDKHQNKADQLTRKLTSALQVIAKAAAKTAISTTGLDGKSVVDALTNDVNQDRTILELRNALSDAVAECIRLDESLGKPKKGFLFFIDDLDRIDPPIAVEILELIKNIFEVDNCIFLLAIDYDVVVKGLEPKFGKLTDKNEREFRSFFDKIIQLPFSMPLGSYSVDEFLIESLVEVNYLDESLRKDSEYKETITAMALASVGTNPRSIKRLINTISLIQIINEIEEGDFGESKHEKLINFGLVCLQIAYPLIYELVVEEPNFIEWNESLAQRLRLAEISDHDKKVLESSPEFDEEWEQVVFRISASDPYLVSKVFNVSRLLNLVRMAVPKNEDFNQILENALTLSKVTSISIDNTKPKKSTGIKDRSKLKFNGQDLPKGRFVLEVIRQYVKDNPQANESELEEVFPLTLQGRLGTFCELSEAIQIVEKTGYKRHFIKDNEVIELHNIQLAVCSQWGSDNIINFINAAKKAGYFIK